MSVQIRNASPEDEAVIASYNSMMAEETEGVGLDPTVINPGVGALLADSSKGRYWVAESNEKVIGQIMVTYEWSDWRNGVLWWIGSVYVHKDWRRKGVFSALYRHVESLAQTDEGVCGLRLYVENSNTRAQETYRALGMEKREYRIMEIDFTKSGAQSNA